MVMKMHFKKCFVFILIDLVHYCNMQHFSDTFCKFEDAFSVFFLFLYFFYENISYLVFVLHRSWNTKLIILNGHLNTRKSTTRVWGGVVLKFFIIFCTQNTLHIFSNNKAPFKNCSFFAIFFFVKKKHSCQHIFE